jgi:serine 3-dehydrogenase
MGTSLSDQVAVVVGASSGMGRAIAVRLAREGASVVAAARRLDRLQELQNELAKENLTIEIVETDATSQSGVERLFAKVSQQFERVDLLVYATGTNISDRSWNELTPETWRMMLDTNLTGAFYCTHSVLPIMRAAGNGLIIYLSSAAVQMPDVSGVCYQASKHGLTGLAGGTRIEEKQNGIRTTIIFPGLCDTEILAKRPTPTPQDVVDQALDPNDVADAVLFVASMNPRATVREMQLLPSRL